MITHKQLEWIDLSDYMAVAKTIFGTVKIIRLAAVFNDSKGNAWDVYLYSPVKEHQQMYPTPLHRVYNIAVSKEEAKTKAYELVQAETLVYLSYFVNIT